MAYSDIYSALNQYGSYYNYGQGAYGVNPYSSAAYMPSLREVYETPAPPKPWEDQMSQ